MSYDGEILALIALLAAAAATQIQDDTSGSLGVSARLSIEREQHKQFSNLMDLLGKMRYR